MLISILVFSFNSAAGPALSYDITIEQAELQRFNNNFEKNTEGDVEIQNIITMVYFAKDYNAKNELLKNDSMYIKIKLGSDDLTQLTDSKLIDMLKDDKYLFSNEDKTEHKKYKCEISYDKEGRVNKVNCSTKK